MQSTIVELKEFEKILDLTVKGFMEIPNISRVTYSFDKCSESSFYISKGRKVYAYLTIEGDKEAIKKYTPYIENYCSVLATVKSQIDEKLINESLIRNMNNLIYSKTQGLEKELKIHKWLEDKLQKEKENLETKVEERTLSLKETVKNLRLAKEKIIESDKKSTMSGLLNGLAKEIRGPLSMIQLTSNYMDETLLNKESQYNELPEVIKDSINIIIKSSNDIDTLITRFEKIANNEYKNEIQKISLKELILDVAENLNYLLKRENIELIIECDYSIIIETHIYPLVEAITNLIKNSIYNKEINKKNKIEITATVNNSNVIISYKDNGKPIRVDEESTIFKAFSENSHILNFELYITYNLIIKDLWGEIYHNRDYDQGVEFIISFPVSI